MHYKILSFCTYLQKHFSFMPSFNHGYRRPCCISRSILLCNKFCYCMEVVCKKVVLNSPKSYGSSHSRCIMMLCKFLCFGCVVSVCL